MISDWIDSQADIFASQGRSGSRYVEDYQLRFISKQYLNATRNCPSASTSSADVSHVLWDLYPHLPMDLMACLRDTDDQTLQQNILACCNILATYVNQIFFVSLCCSVLLSFLLGCVSHFRIQSNHSCRVLTNPDLLLSESTKH